MPSAWLDSERRPTNSRKSTPSEQGSKARSLKGYAPSAYDAPATLAKRRPTSNTFSPRPPLTSCVLTAGSVMFRSRKHAGHRSPCS